MAIQLTCDLHHREGRSMVCTGSAFGKRERRMFHMCWALSDGSCKLIPINEQPNHQIVHLFRLGKANGATHEPLNPGPQIDVLALDFLRVLLAYVMPLWVDMPLVGSPSIRVQLGDAEWLQELLQLEE